MAKKQGRIESNLRTAGEVLSADFRYKVPPHQRNFSWTLEEVGQLWDDVMYAIREDVPDYFVGTVVVQESRERKERTIIDGQQRLATLTMILAGIRTLYHEHGDDRADEVYRDYLGARHRRTRSTEPRLTLNEVNEPAFEQLVVCDVPDEQLRLVAKDKATAPSNVLMAKAALFIREAMRKKAGSEPKYEDFLLELEDFLKDRVMVILVAVGDEADAYLIFETLNDRGLELSISDLLKNYIFGRAGIRNLDLVRRQWQEMVVILGSQDQTQFLRHYWLSRYGVVRERELYREMKRRFGSETAIVRLMNELRAAVDKYAALLNIGHQIWREYETRVRKDLETLQLFGLSQYRPLLLAALEVFSQDDIGAIIRMVVALSMRYNIIGSLGTGIIEAAYSDVAVAVREGNAKSPAAVFNMLRHIYPDDARFKADFTQKQITKSKIARYILAATTNKVEGIESHEVLQDENRVNLEHIMPKTRSGEWMSAAKDEDEYLENVDRLGNLTLIERERNRAAGNASFEKKKVAFVQSGIQITKDLASYQDWGVAQINQRQEKLAAMAVEIWRLPY